MSRRGRGERERGFESADTFSVGVSVTSRALAGCYPTRLVGYFYSASSPGGLGRFKKHATKARLGADHVPHTHAVTGNHT